MRAARHSTTPQGVAISREPMACPNSNRLELIGLGSDLVGPFDLALAAGDCVAVTGASGSGKSLMLRLVADLDPGRGDVRLDGVSRARIAPTAWRRRVAYLAAETGFWAEEVAAHFTDLPAARALGSRLLLSTGLFEGLVARLSTGERARLALVRTLLLDPPLLLLDEPTGPLDAAAVAAVESVLRERLAGGTSILLVTHDPAQAARLGARRLVMRAGKLGGPDCR